MSSLQAKQLLEKKVRNEVQQHGFKFEDWVRSTFFDSYIAPSYTNEWDISAEANKNFGGLPVSVKTAKYGSPLNLGDALLRYQVSCSFLMIVGFWQQQGKAKRFVNATATIIHPEKWRKLWHPITQTDLQQLNTVIKETKNYQEARKLAQYIKNQSPFTEAIITVNPKIDSKKQRRLQCSIRFNAFFDHLTENADRSISLNPTLFDTAMLLEVQSLPRTFRSVVQNNDD